MSRACAQLKGCLYLAGHRGECQTSALMRFATIPDEPYTEIAAGLYQGSGHWMPKRHQFDAVLTLYKRAVAVEDGIAHREWFFNDSAEMPDEEALGEAIDWVRRKWLNANGNVLIRCQAGLNRSGLVVAATLINVVGGSPDEVIRLMRTKRSPYVLCNTTFDTYLRAMA